MKKLSLGALILTCCSVYGQEFLSAQEAYRSIQEDSCAPEAVRHLGDMMYATIKNQEFLPKILEKNEEIIKQNADLIKQNADILNNQEKILANTQQKPTKNCPHK